MSYNLSNVSVYVVDLKKLSPFGDPSLSAGMPTSSGPGMNANSAGGGGGGGGGGGVVFVTNSGGGGGNGGGSTTFRHGQTFRKSFNKERPPGGLRQNELKMSLEAAQESDDKSSTETDDDGLIGTADIKDLGHYHNIFQPRARECTSGIFFFFLQKNLDQIFYSLIWV